MKTEEIDVWVDRDEFDNYDAADCTYVLLHEKNITSVYLKAKIIIEMPEKTITVTESEFDEAIKAHGEQDLRYRELVIDNVFASKLKKELGF
tara:strand:+ start:6646 stop:6921 length:276 start_codon:yes stop_codon:yes gene_type:complete